MLVMVPLPVLLMILNLSPTADEKPRVRLRLQPCEAGLLGTWPRSTLPLTETASKEVPDVPFRRTPRVEVEAPSKIRLPAMVRTPVVVVPGASVPPKTLTVLTVPLPPSVPPALTVTALLLLLPFTQSVPAFTVVVPV